MYCMTVCNVKKIASGVFGIVFRVKLNGKVYAVKVDKDGSMVTSDHKIHVKLYNTLDDKCKKIVPEPVTNVQTLEELKILVGNKNISAMEYVPGVTLLKFLHKTNDCSKLLKVKNNLRKALLCMWKAGFIHGDLHLENVIVAKCLTVKFIDFGYTVKVTPLKDTNNISIRNWFGEQWPIILKFWGVEKGNPNVHAYGLYTNYPIGLNMFATNDKTLLSKFHSSLKGQSHAGKKPR